MVLQDAQATVEDIAGLALKTAAKRGRKAATLENKRNCWEAKIVPSFRGRHAALLSHGEAQDAADGWASHFGPHAAKKAAREAGHGWRLAMQRGWLLRSPWDGVYVAGATRSVQRFMSAEDRQAFRAYLEPIALRGVHSRFPRVTAQALLFLAEVPTGRMGETASLEWRGVNLRDRLVTWFRHKTDKSGPKHSALSDYSVAILEAARRSAPWSPWVFPSSAPIASHVKDLTGSMARVCAHIGLARHTPHDLRRGIAQEALDAGASIEDVSALLGHESVRTTESYLRWSPTRARRALDLVTLGGRR